MCSICQQWFLHGVVFSNVISSVLIHKLSQLHYELLTFRGMQAECVCSSGISLWFPQCSIRWTRLQVLDELRLRSMMSSPQLGCSSVLCPAVLKETELHTHTHTRTPGGGSIACEEEKSSESVRVCIRGLWVLWCGVWILSLGCCCCRLCEGVWIPAAVCAEEGDDDWWVTCPVTFSTEQLWVAGMTV